MNWEHFKAFAWLRWRLLYNQARRAGVFNAVLLLIVAVGALVTAIPLFIGGLILGLYAIPRAAPVHLMYAWDIVVGGFLLFWTIGVITELQRSDPLSLSKFLHLPVSVNSAFLINYLGSLVRLSLIVYGPVMLAFSLALILVKGFTMLPVLLLVTAFILMVTALTYQFQGWLAALMSNPRRRRTVIAIVTLSFVLIAQLPNLLNFLAPWGSRQFAERAAANARALAQESEQITRDLQSRKIDANEAIRRTNEIQEKLRHGTQQTDRETMAQLERTARFVNMVVPFGWLPLGVVSAAERSFVPVILGLVGMTLIGSASLYRAYRTTIGLYTGQFTNRKGRAAATVKRVDAPGQRRAGFLETRLPGLSDPVSAVALASFRSLVRAPEAKMMLLSPVIMTIIFGSMFWRGRQGIADGLIPLVAFGAMVFVLFGVVQLMTNQFGFDRDGFRVYVLSAARRRDVLMGKNLSFAPLVLGMAAILLIILQVIRPMRWDHFLALIPQYLSMFLLFCILANLLSIYAPVYVAPGSLKPSNPKLVTALLHLVSFMFVFPLMQAVTLIPLGTEFVLRFLGWGPGVPICLLLSLLEFALVVVVYHFSLDARGYLFQDREQAILEMVTKKAT